MQNKNEDKLQFKSFKSNYYFFILAAIFSTTLKLSSQIVPSQSTGNDSSFNFKLKALSSSRSINYTQNIFAIIGDYGWSGPNESSVANLVKSWSPEYIITVGDNNYREGASSTIDANIGQYYHDYIKPYSGIYGAGADINRFFPALGNHDLVTSSGAAYFQYFNLYGNERYYDYVKGNVHFFVLNGDPSEVDGITSSSVQALWLKNKLASSTEKWKIVYLHQSPYASDLIHGNDVTLQWPFKTWGADVVISGNSHIYERIINNNFPYFVNGLGGESKYSLSPSPISGSQIRYNANYGAMKVTVRPDTLWFKFYNISNTLIDSYPLVKSNSTTPTALVVSITSPANNSAFSPGSTITIQATASGGTGTIQKVEFYQDSTKIGEDITAPYSFNWLNVSQGNYALTARVTDSGNNSAVSSTVNISVSPTVTCSATGTISREVWNNISGTSVSAIPLSIAPGSTSQLSIFEAPQNVADNYGQRIRGYVCAPLTGNYIFWIASDDNSELWLSTNDQPANKVKIASVTGYTGSRAWTKYSTQQSASKYLIAGQKYYIEALLKEGSQGDNCAVGWQLPNGTLERPIPGGRLSPYSTSSNNSPFVSITSPTNNTSFPSPTNITINASATSSGGSITKVEFYQGSTKIGEDLTAPYSFTWMNVTTGTYALKAIATDNTNHAGTSQIINVLVNTCSTPKITPLGPTTMCSGSVTLQSNTGSGFIYQWQKNGVNISGATNSTYMATASGSYQIKIIQGSCISRSAPTTVKIQSGLRASITPGGPTTFCSGGNVKLFANTCSGYTYQWKKNGSYISGATGATYTATTSGNYQVQIRQNRVNAWSALVTVTLNACRESEINQNEETDQVQTISDLSDSLRAFQMKVYPNPNTGLFTIVLNMPLIKVEKVKMRIVNILGQEVYSKEFVIKDNDFKENIELDRSLPTGIYTLQVIMGNMVENTSLVLSR